MRRCSSWVAAAALACSFPTAQAGPYEEGKAAYEAGDFRRAGELLRGEAEKENTDAQCFMGSLLVNGQGRPADREAGLRWYRRAAEHGSALAWLNLGILAGKEGQGREAIACLAKAAAARPDAAARLGEIHLFGEAGIPKDDAEAARWFAFAAEGGNGGACNNLGLLYERGAGVPRDPARAMELFTRGAEHGERRAEANLGRMWYSGAGVPHDLMKARTWLSLSARHGEVTARKLLPEIEDKLTPEETTANEREVEAIEAAKKPAAPEAGKTATATAQ